MNKINVFLMFLLPKVQNRAKPLKTPKKTPWTL